RAWDGSSGAEGDIVDVSVNGGTTAFSAQEETAAVAIVATNSAPVFDTLGGASFGAGAEDAALSGSIADLLENASDADAGAGLGIAVTGVDDANGTWEYSLDGATWATLDGSDGAARLLDLESEIRFTPDADFNGTATISYRAWDRTTGLAGDAVDVTSNGGVTAFSALTETATATITAVNDAPVLDAAETPALPDVTEDATAPAGVRIADILSTPVSAIASTAAPSASVIAPSIRM
ncbi:MAG: Ig-like domain-containing protein, partial [Pseudomonadota bacterium]